MCRDGRLGMTRGFSCICELIRCDDENTLNYILVCKRLSIDKLIMEIELETSN